MDAGGRVTQERLPRTYGQKIAPAFSALPPSMELSIFMHKDVLYFARGRMPVAIWPGIQEGSSRTSLCFDALEHPTHRAGCNYRAAVSGCRARKSCYILTAHAGH